MNQNTFKFLGITLKKAQNLVYNQIKTFIYYLTTIE